MKILHFAIENYARVPANLVKAERKLGHESYLMSLYRTSKKFDDEDFCLNMPFVATKGVNLLRRVLSPEKSTVLNVRRKHEQGFPVWRPSNALVATLFRLRDRLWEPKIRAALDSVDIQSFDLLSLDGGAGFLRNAKIVQELKESGLKIITCYCGSDLRTRGLIAAVDELADARFTFEYDHTLLYPKLKFLFFPFALRSYPRTVAGAEGRIRIGHAPTNRAAKGTEEILAGLAVLRQDHPVEIVLIENMPHREALSLKASCDIFVDTIGELGYGVNSLESLAMGIPTAVEILPDFAQLLGAHPFINLNGNNMAEQLAPFVKSESLRREIGKKGKSWVKRIHDPVRVAQTILSAVDGN